MTPQEKVDQAVTAFPQATVPAEELAALYWRALDAVTALHEVSGSRRFSIEASSAVGVLAA